MRIGAGPIKECLIGEVFLELWVRVVHRVTKLRCWSAGLAYTSTPIRDEIIRLYQGSSPEGFYPDLSDREWFDADLLIALRQADFRHDR
jgi:hypothetical protein